MCDKLSTVSRKISEIINGKFKKKYNDFKIIRYISNEHTEGQ